MITEVELEVDELGRDELVEELADELLDDDAEELVDDPGTDELEDDEPRLDEVEL